MEEFFNKSIYYQIHNGVGYLPEVILDLDDKEKAEAEDLLIESVKKGDMWPTKGLACLKSKKALPILKEKIKNSPPVLRIRIAAAIEDIEGSGEYIPVLISEFLSARTSDRVEAAMVLGNYPTQEVIDALFKGIMDPNYLIRNHSADSLLKIHGFKPYISEYKKIFECIMSSSTKELNAKAVELLKNLFKTLPKIKTIIEKERKRGERKTKKDLIHHLLQQGILREWEGSMKKRYVEELLSQIIGTSVSYIHKVISKWKLSHPQNSQT